mmetsp:Transcript_41172/g.30277  ORF Transcript_41172/g.30277 Transcript_41172/m.30277 type:complete len:81 (-) Transcript_41172:234-476(-)
MYWDIRLLSHIYFTWFYLRFFMIHKLHPQQVGDPSDGFALHTFFPEKVQTSVKGFGDKCFAVVSVTGFFDYIQKRFKSPL